jgi:DNA-binding CsgD family transcriptional regulator
MSGQVGYGSSVSHRSTRTRHISTIQTKLDMRNRVEIAAWAWEHGLVRGA